MLNEKVFTPWFGLTGRKSASSRELVIPRYTRIGTTFISAESIANITMCRNRSLASEISKSIKAARDDKTLESMNLLEERTTYEGHSLQKNLPNTSVSRTNTYLVCVLCVPIAIGIVGNPHFLLCFFTNALTSSSLFIATSWLCTLSKVSKASMAEKSN
jgi:hypothetical protein